MAHARPRPPRSSHVAGLACLLGLTLCATGGCSFLLVHPPPARADWPDPVTPHSSQTRCTRSPAPPVVDTTIAVGLGTLAALGQERAATPLFPPIVGGVAATYLVSAVYGYWNMSRCRDYQHLFTEQAEREQK